MLVFWEKMASPVKLLMALIFLGPSLMSQGQEVQEPPEVIQLPAFGRVAQLGEFYDATDELFQNQLIFQTHPSLDVVTKIENPSTETKFRVVESMSQKLDFLGVSAYLAVVLKCASFEVSVKGSCSFIKDERQSAKHVEGFLSHKTQTARESIDLFSEEIRPYIDVIALMETTASHVVTAIYYGADVAVKFTDTNFMNEDLEDIRGKLEISFSLQEMLKVEAMAEVNITNGDFSNSSTYDLQVSADIPINTIPTNSFQVLELIQKIPEILMGINDEKGKPISYVLTPLTVLQSAYDLEYMNAKIVSAVDEVILSKILVLFEDISVTRASMNDLQDLFRTYQDKCLTPSVKQSLDELSNNFDLRAGNFTRDIRLGLIQLRARNITTDVIQDILTQYIVHPVSPANVNIKLDHDFEDGKRKIEFYKSFAKHRVQYFSEPSYEANLVNTKDSIFYVLFYNLTLIDANVTAWEEGTHIFFGHLNNPFWSKLKVVDCDFPLGNSRCKSLTQTEIHGFINYERVSSDVLSDIHLYFHSNPLRLPPVLQSGQGLTDDQLYNVGQLYNRRDGKFIEGLILSKSGNVSLIKDERDKPIPPFACEIIHPSWKSMFLALKVPQMYQVPVLLRNLYLRGAGQILSQSPYENGEYDYLNLVCERFTGKLSLSVNEKKERLVQLLDFNSLVEITEATHFVQSREWSATTVISMGMLKSGSSQEELTQKLDGIKSLVEQDATNADVLIDNELINFERVNVTIYSDVFPHNEIKIKTWNETIDVLDIVTSVFEEDPTHGVPMYTVYPIVNLQLDYGIITSFESKDNPVVYRNLGEFPSVYDRISNIQFRIENQTQFLNKFHECTPETERQEIERLYTSFQTNFDTWKTDMSQEYSKFFLTGNSDGLDELMEHAHNVWEDGKTALTGLLSITEKLTEIESFYEAAKNRYQYVESERKWRNAFYSALEKRVYVLFYRLEWLFPYQVDWLENLSTFFANFYDQSVGSFIVDCSFFEGSDICENVTRPVIHEYTNGIPTSLDMLETLRKEEGGDAGAQAKLWKTLGDHKMTEGSLLDATNQKITDTSMELETCKSDMFARIQQLNETIMKSPGGLPPVGFIYNQYPGESTPTELWGPTWQTISFPGQFGNFFMKLDF